MLKTIIAMPGLCQPEDSLLLCSSLCAGHSHGPRVAPASSGSGSAAGSCIRMPEDLVFICHCALSRRSLVAGDICQRAGASAATAGHTANLGSHLVAQTEVRIPHCLQTVH